MKKNMKRAATLVTATCLVIGLTACEGNVVAHTPPAMTTDVGGVAFVVDSFAETETLGDNTADGKYLVLTITMTNNSHQSAGIGSSQFRLLSNDEEFRSGSISEHMASQDLPGGNPTFFFLQNDPGASSTGNSVFDVPADVVDAGDLRLQVSRAGLTAEIPLR
ncbi:MAG: DUF4352 domain-containing protein [Cellulomonadaceae bacterium]|jgi:hypothetical protein|nr:DUF4352 domain-containing protein [Cellulomonadaceae bacterium]